MLIAYKFRLKTNKDQEEYLMKTTGCVRFVYNYFLDLTIKAYAKGKSLSKYDLMKMLTKLKHKKGFEFLQEVDSTSLQQCIHNLYQAYENFFRGQGFPRFKARNFSRRSARLMQSHKLGYKDSTIKIGKLGYFKVLGDLNRVPKKHKIKSITISMDSDQHWYASLLVEQRARPKLPKTKKSIGIDLGLKTTLTLSNGVRLDSPKSTKKYATKLAKAQRNLSRKVKGSNNRNKARIKVAKINHKIKSSRRDFNHKASKQLVIKYDKIYVEDLNIKGMVKTNLAKSIHDQSWGQFLNFLNYKAEWYGKAVYKVDRFFPSSKTCSFCGLRKKKLPLNVREWTCNRCSTEHDRDINAAKNIRRYGLLSNKGKVSNKKEYSKHLRIKYQLAS